MACDRRRVIELGATTVAVSIAGCTAVLGTDSEDELVAKYATVQETFEDGLEALETGRERMGALEHSEAERRFDEAGTAVENGREQWDGMAELASDAEVSTAAYAAMMHLQYARRALGRAVESHRTAVRNTDDGEQIPADQKENASEDYTEVVESDYLTASEVEEIL